MITLISSPFSDVKHINVIGHFKIYFDDSENELECLESF